MTAMRRAAIAAVLLGLVAAACSGGTSSSPTASAATSFSLEVASSDLYVGAPQRFQIGVFRSTDQGIDLLTGGSIPLTLVAADGGDPISGQAHYVSAPGLPSPDTPSLTTPSQARGVYEMDVTFPLLGVWTAQLSFTASGQPVDLTTSFGVSDRPALPAPGDRAFATKNLTMADAKTEPQAVDSRAQDGAKVPDPELHQHTIAQGLAEHRPMLVLFATPVYCQSQFCGPSTDALEQIAKAGPPDAYSIHVEIYKHYGTGTNQELNQAAAQWLLRNNDLTEPWLFLIGRDGRILDRWGPLFDPAQVSRELEKADR